MNLLKLIGLIVANKAKEVVLAVEDSVTHTVRVLSLAIGSAAVLLFLGITVAALGAVEVGRGIILAGGFVSMLLFVLFSTRALLLGELLVLASQLGHGAVNGIPQIEREKADSLLKWMRGITVWVMIFSFYSMFFPVWENVGNFIIASSCIIMLATMASAWENGVPSFRKAATWSVLAVFLSITFQFFAPETAAKLKNSAAYWTSRVTDIGNRKEALGKVEHQAKLTEDNQDAAILAKIRKEQADLRLKAINDAKCFGVICDKADEERYAMLEAAAKQIMARTQAAAEPEKEEVASTPGFSSKLPPPPSTPVAKPANKTPVTEPAKSVSADDKEVDETFKELAKYGL